MSAFAAGFCYLSVVKEEHRNVVKEVVGRGPPVGVFFFGVEAYQLDDEKLLECGWYEGYDVDAGQDVYHIGMSGKGKRVASVASVLVARMGAKAPVSPDVFRRAAVCPVVVDQDCCIGQDVEARGQVPVSEALVALSGVDMAECFCQVHNAPLTLDSQFAVEGCCKRPAGRAAVVAAAFDRKNVMCHAGASVRVADAKFLNAVISGKDPGMLDGRMRPDWFARLCTSSEATDRAAFGNGYCYLDAMEHDTLWRCARLLGPNPLISAVANVLLWAGKVSAKKFVLKRVKDGFYHLLRDKASKGVDVRAGKKLLKDLLALAEREPGARIGADVPPFGGPGPPLVETGRAKVHCSVCDCMVVADGHEARCRPKSVKGLWSDRRKLAWLGDTVHRLDVQLAVSRAVSAPARWEVEVQLRVTNAAQAAYMRSVGLGRDDQPDHLLGTEFEARYAGEFRLRYLRAVFPVGWRGVADAWEPPVVVVAGQFGHLNAINSCRWYGLRSFRVRGCRGLKSGAVLIAMAVVCVWWWLIRG